MKVGLFNGYVMSPKMLNLFNDRVVRVENMSLCKKGEHDVCSR